MLSGILHEVCTQDKPTLQGARIPVWPRMLKRCSSWLRCCGAQHAASVCYSSWPSCSSCIGPAVSQRAVLCCDHLAVAPSCCTSLDAKGGALAGLADAGNDLQAHVHRGRILVGGNCGNMERNKLA
jgi:hypothetical protein